MLLAYSLRNFRQVTSAHFLFFQQSLKTNQFASISSYHRFLQKDDETAKRKTGLVNKKHFTYNQLDLHRAIHSRNALFFNTSKPSGHKLVPKPKPIEYETENETKKIETKIEVQPEKKVEVKEVTLDALEESQHLGLFARFKKMAKEYWYVLIPVHVVTSSVWIGAFYYASKSGVDIIGLLEHYNFSETIIKPLRNSHLGHIAVAYFLYKIATPARYFVTLGGTTFAIKQGIKRGLIKPMPSKDALVQIYKDKKIEVNQKVADQKQAMQDKKQEFKDKYMKKD